ncbi:AAA family ATPase [Chondromyces apiculatus]|nr:AAA family ATPase [Chondromyces apiculatus]
MRPLLRVRARNFRSLRDVDVALQALNVLVGSNGSGKSNFLDLIHFLGDAVREDLRPALERRGGYERVRFRGDEKRGIEITIEARVTRHASNAARDVYTLRFQEDPVRRFVEAHHPQKTSVSLGLSTLPRLAPERGGEQVSKIAQLFSTFRVFDVNVNAARLPAPLRRGERLDSDASNLAPFLRKLAGDQETFSALVEDARAMIPGLVQIHFRSIGGAEEGVAVELEERGLQGRTSLADASDGSIRVLALLAMLYDPEPPQLTCAEEIDHGLHPYVFDRLVELLREASQRTQFLVVTHSPALVNRLNASELIVVERDQDTGATRMPAVDPEKVQRIEEKLAGKMGLGELWFSGTLGGNP